MTCRRLTIEEFNSLPPGTPGYEDESKCNCCVGTGLTGTRCPDAPDAYRWYDFWGYDCQFGTGWNKGQGYGLVNCYTDDGSIPPGGRCSDLSGVECQQQGSVLIGEGQPFKTVPWLNCCSWAWTNMRMIKPMSKITGTTAWNGNSFGCGSVQLTKPYEIPEGYWLHQSFGGCWSKGIFNPNGISVFERDPMLNWLMYGCNSSTLNACFQRGWGAVIDGEYVQTTPLTERDRFYTTPEGCDFLASAPPVDCTT